MELSSAVLHALGDCAHKADRSSDAECCVGVGLAGKSCGRQSRNSLTWCLSTRGDCARTIHAPCRWSILPAVHVCRRLQINTKLTLITCANAGCFRRCASPHPHNPPTPRWNGLDTLQDQCWRPWYRSPSGAVRSMMAVPCMGAGRVWIGRCPRCSPVCLTALRA